MDRIEDGSIEAGWTLFCEMTLPRDAPADEIGERRYSFMAGAEYVLALITACMSIPEREESMRKLDRMYDECAQIRRELYLRYARERGCA